MRTNLLNNNLRWLILLSGYSTICVRANASANQGARTFRRDKKKLNSTSWLK